MPDAMNEENLHKSCGALHSLALRPSESESQTLWKFFSERDACVLFILAASAATNFD